MPIDREQRRSYGYIEANSPSQEPRKTRPSKKSLKTQQSKLLGIFVLPLHLIWVGLRQLWRLWNGRPRLPKQARGTLRRGLAWALLTFVLVFVVGGTVTVAFMNRSLPDPDKLTDRQVAESTKIYDRTGTTLLFEVFADEKRTLIKLSDIPKPLIQGVIATEDTDFYNHHGIRPLSILRSAVYGVLRRQRPRGTSTLTQQLVKNVILNNDKTLTRKVKEAILAVQMEQKYTKDQILQIYFNEIPYGSTNYGVESAAQSYFGKSVRDLNLQEAATLAGLPQKPSVFLNNPDALHERRNFVLRRMYEEGYITKEQKDAAQAEPVTLEQKYNNIKAPHFVKYVQEQLKARFGEEFVNTAGLKVITSLDWDKQQLAEESIRDEAEKLFAEANANNAGLLAMDPRTGHILAMVGSRNFFDKSIRGEFNVTTQALRQPGSSFKPIVYSAAFEKGYTPDTVLFDVSTNFAISGKPYQPQNYDLKEHGLVTMRKALQGSLNIPAVKTLYLVGEKKAIEFAQRLGYSTFDQGDFGLTLVLGGGEVRMIDHVAAYAVFANRGVKMNPVSILRVENSQGDVLMETGPDRGERVLDEKIAATITDVLNDDGARAFAFGSLGILTLKDRPVAAKTGTTNNYADAWTVGYTPSIAAGVWVGNWEGATKPMKRGFGGNKLAGVIWNHFMRAVVEGTPVEQFPDPPPNDAEKPVLRGSVNGITLPIDRVTGKRATSSTPEAYIVNRTFIPPHDILHYVNKDDPRGPVPEDPTADPQYTRWEESVADWIRRSREANPAWEISFEEPPTEFDDAHSLELIPSLTLVRPAPSSTLSSRQLDTEIEVSAPRGVTRVTYKIDGRLIETVEKAPFNLHTTLRGVADGPHTITIIVEDDIGNRREEQVPVVLAAGEEPPTVAWIENTTTFSQNDFPRVFLLNPFQLKNIRSIRVYKERDGTGTRSLMATITDFSTLFDNHITVRWEDVPNTGLWHLSTEVESTRGEVNPGDSIDVIVR